MSQTEKDSIIKEAIEHGIAFVEDDFIITDTGEEVYNPTVDRHNAELWLLELINRLSG